MATVSDPAESRHALYDTFYTDETLKAALEAPLGFATSHLCAASHVPLGARSVLDIGCGVGAFGRLLKARGPIHVVGIDFYESAVEVARRYIDEALVADLDNGNSPWAGPHFDVISCLDVLEHVVDPPGLLAKATPLLNPGGWLILSVPNVLHRTVIWRMLVERQWGDEAVCDWRHLRFFTLTTLAQTLQQAGFVLDPNILATTMPEHPLMVQLVRNIADLMGGSDALVSESEVYQYVLRARYVGGLPAQPAATVRKIPNRIDITLDEALAALATVPTP